MLRILFEKTGNGVWISHLDLMRVFQRAFRRAGLALRHTEGFNPHAFVSILLPLSVGASSVCEILEFELNEMPGDLGEIVPKLNRTLPDGISCVQAWEAQKKAKELAFLRARVTMEYDAGVQAGAVEAITALLARPTLEVEKRSKKGLVPVDIIPMLRETAVSATDGSTVTIEATVCAQNPSLNPALLATAVEAYLPQLRPDFSSVRRLEIYDGSMEIFR